MARIDVDFSGGAGKRASDSTVIPPERAGLKTFINILVTLITAIVAFYFMLPPLNFKAPEFYIYLAIVFGSYIVSSLVTSRAIIRPEYVLYVKRNSIVAIYCWLYSRYIRRRLSSSATLFRAKAYSRMLNGGDRLLKERYCYRQPERL